MNNILTAEEIKNYKDIGSKIDANKINPIISQAQDDLRDFLGMTFYFDILANLTNPIYESLLNGSDFIYDRVTFHQDGLKAMLADLFVAKYLPQINTNMTPFGATTKLSTDSEPASESSLKNIAFMNKQMAGSKWEIIKLYLKENRFSFPNYNAFTDTIQSGERQLKFRKL